MVVCSVLAAILDHVMIVPSASPAAWLKLGHSVAGSWAVASHFACMAQYDACSSLNEKNLCVLECLRSARIPRVAVLAVHAIT